MASLEIGVYYQRFVIRISNMGGPAIMQDLCLFLLDPFLPLKKENFLSLKSFDPMSAITGYSHVRWFV